MKQLTLQRYLQNFADKGINAYSTRMLESYFPDESTTSFRKTLAAAVNADILQRVCRGVYVFPPSFSQEIYKLERIAVILRMGFYSYTSLESALSGYGVISQIPLNRLTVMTTGRKQTYETPYGIIEFTHTARKEFDIINNTVTIDNCPLRLATVETALADLRRVGRNLNLVNHAIYEEMTQ